MGDWIASIAGTPEGARLAMALALTAAVAHAAFGALQKGRHDPWLSRGAIDAAIVALVAPAALFVAPWPQGWEWAILAGAVAIHFVYKLLMATAYSLAAFSVVYPVVRGSGTLVTVLFAGVVFAERYSVAQWLGVLMLSGGILAIALANLRGASAGRRALRLGLATAFAGGASVAVYTTYDAWGIRATPDPFTFLAWFFLLSSVDFAVIGALRWRRMPEAPALGPLALRGVLGAVIAFVSFGGVMLATRLDRVGEAAVLRETSVVFAALIGRAFLGERIGALRAALVVVIAAGAVMVEFG